MINKVIVSNIFNLNELQQKKPLDPSKIDFENQVKKLAKNAILKQPEEAKTSLIDRVIKTLKNVLGKITNCFKSCLKIEDAEEVKNQQRKNVQKPLEKNVELPKQPVLEKIENQPKEVLPIINIQKLSADELFKEAINLMFENERLTWVQYHQAKPIGPFTEEELIQRHEHLKKIIALIPADHINDGIQYREGMGARTTNLLLHAILNIKNAERRIEIVKILIERGINIHQEGAFYVPVTAIQAAEEVQDLRLLALLLGKDEKQISKEAVGEVADLLMPCPVGEEREILGDEEYDNYTKYQNYLQIPKILFKILPEHINLTITLKQDGHVYTTPLLFLAVAMVDNIDMLIPIVESLLKKGADPHINGILNGEPHPDYNVLKRAEKRGNQKLLQILYKAMK